LPDTKNVVGTNVIEIAWRLDPRTGRLIVMSAEDNLVKGASGQAVQSMNSSAVSRKRRGWFELIRRSRRKEARFKTFETRDLVCYKKIWNAADYAANSAAQQIWARELIAKLNCAATNTFSMSAAATAR
jgi:hypothetical protein